MVKKIFEVECNIFPPHTRGGPSSQSSHVCVNTHLSHQSFTERSTCSICDNEPILSVHFNGSPTHSSKHTYMCDRIVIVVSVSPYSSDHDRGTFLPQNAQLLQKNQPSTNKVKCVRVSCCTLCSCEHEVITVVLSHLGLCV